LISSTWKSSRYFSGVVAGELCTIGEFVWYRKLLLLFIVLITTKNMGSSECDTMNTTLVSYMYTNVKVITKTAESPKAYQIPIHIVFGILKSFPDKGDMSALDHLELIEDRCTLFKLAEVSNNEAKKKLLYLSLDDEARAWMRSIIEETILDWEDMTKAFYLKYYPPIEAYRDRGLIYNIWPHLEESIAQAWGRLKKYIRKNPCHDISKSIILINFYVRLLSFYKDFLNNSSGESFISKRADDAWELLDLVMWPRKPEDNVGQSARALYSIRKA
jgi:hypothetical protein